MLGQSQPGQRLRRKDGHEVRESKRELKPTSVSHQNSYWSDWPLTLKMHATCRRGGTFDPGTSHKDGPEFRDAEEDLVGAEGTAGPVAALSE